MSAIENTKKGVEEILLGLLDKGVEAIEKGGEFLGEQIPLVVQELLLFKSFYHGISLLMCLFFLYVAYRIIKVLPQYYKDAQSSYNLPKSYVRKYDELPAFLGGIFGTVAAIVFLLLGLIGVFTNAATFMMIILAPRLYLLEYSSQLVN